MKDTDELPENLVYREHVVKAFFRPAEGSKDYKEMEKFIHNRRNGVVYKCDPDKIEDVVYYDFILLCALIALDEPLMWKQQGAPFWCPRQRKREAPVALSQLSPMGRFHSSHCCRGTAPLSSKPRTEK